MADDEEKKEESGGGAPAWMCTFADLMSLLLSFFVLLLSFSVMDNMKYKQVAGSMKDAFGIQKEEKTFESPQGQQILSQEFQTIPLDVQLRLAESIREEVEEGLVEVEHTGEGTILRIKGEVAFASGSATIKPRFRKILDRLAGFVKDEDVLLEVGGHTDNVPVRPGAPFTSNYDLSARRAVAVVEYWRKRYQIPSAKLAAVGYADGHPIADNNTAAGRARNRRVEFFIRPPRLGAVAFGGIEELKRKVAP